VIGFVVAMAVAGVVTAAALAPPPRGWSLGQLCWRLGMQANELPFVVAAWVLAATALAAAQGTLRGPAGVAGAGAAALILAGLVVVTMRALRTEPLAARAIVDGLRAAGSAEPSPQTAPVRRPRPWLRLLFAPLAVRRRDVVRRANLRYGPAGRANLLDLYLPRSGATTGPCLVYFHGGGYRSGRKNREARALLYRLASQGWVCVSANYRLAAAARYPAPLADAKRVISWMRDNAPSYGADPSSITVAGSSAGAHLAAMAALTPNTPALQPGFESADTRVIAAICLYGFYGTPTWIDQEHDAPSAPADLVDDHAPPMFLAHGTHDGFASVSDVRDFVNRFRAAAPHSPMVYLELPGAQHTFDLYHSVRFDAVLGAIDAFVDGIRVTAPSTTAR
jgi:acetyl esterase/lipase